MLTAWLAVFLQSLESILLISTVFFNVTESVPLLLPVYSCGTFSVAFYVLRDVTIGYY